MQRHWEDGKAVLRARWYLRDATSVGPRVRLWGRACVRSAGTLVIRDRVRIDGRLTPVELATGPDGVLEIGESTFINYGTSLSALASVRIGANCTIGTYCLVMDNDFHRLEPERRQELPDSAPVVLEENVWLGARVVVLRGVTIGQGSVVGAGSVVVKDVPARCLVAGQPAREIRKL